MRLDIAYAYERLYSHFQERLHRNEWLKRHSSFGAGGPADLWVSVKTQKELIDLIGLCTQEEWPLLVVGAGINILYADAGVRGIPEGAFACHSLLTSCVWEEDNKFPTL